MTVERIVVISDTQIPYDDRKALKAVIRFIGDWQPDKVIHIGDLMDFPQPSRWSKGTAAEFEGDVFADCEQAKARFLDPLRAVYDGWIGVHIGNHDRRPYDYLKSYAPALAESGAFDLNVLLDFDGYDIEKLDTFHEVAPGCLTTHGDRGGISLNRIAGNTAMGAARKFTKSVVMGHTHRIGIIGESKGYAGKITSQLFGMEVGNLMDMKQAAYLKEGTGNWQQGFGILTVDGQHVKPEIIPITKGKFSVDGEVWEV